MQRLLAWLENMLNERVRTGELVSSVNAWDVCEIHIVSPVAHPLPRLADHLARDLSRSRSTARPLHG